MAILLMYFPNEFYQPYPDGVTDGLGMAGPRALIDFLFVAFSKWQGPESASAIMEKRHIIIFTGDSGRF